MIMRNSESKMAMSQQPISRIDTMELKFQIERKLGQQKSEKYFNLLGRYLGLKLSKSEFNNHCLSLLGRENICLHNELIRAIIKNASLAKSPPPKRSKIESPLDDKVQNGCQRSSLQSLCKDLLPQSPRKRRTPNHCERKLKDGVGIVGRHGKAHKVQEQQSATELLSLGSRPPVEVNSVEEGEEVEQASESPGIYSRSPVRAPLGISIHTKETRKVLRNGSAPAFYSQTCHSSGELPETSSLKKRLEQKLEMEGLKISTDCVSLLNNGLDVFLKRLVRPCLQLAGSRSQHSHLRPMRYIQKPNRSFSASMLDFRVTMESNPRILGEDWPVQLEKVCLFPSEESGGADYQMIGVGPTTPN